MQTGHLQALRETPDQREVLAQGLHEDNMFEAKTVDQMRSTCNGCVHTELSVTLSYLPRRINNRIHCAGNDLLLQDFAESGIVQLDIRAQCAHLNVQVRNSTLE
jgi:hypothetical protein